MESGEKAMDGVGGGSDSGLVGLVCPLFDVIP